MGLKNGTVKTFDTSTYEIGSSITCNKQLPVRGVAALPDGSIITCLENGNLQRWKNDQCDVWCLQYFCNIDNKSSFFSRFFLWKLRFLR